MAIAAGAMRAQMRILPHVRQHLTAEARNPVRVREVSQTQLEVLATGVGPLLELLDQLLRRAVDGTVFCEERAALGDLPGFTLVVGHRDLGDGPRLLDLDEIPAHIVTVPFEHVQLVLEEIDRTALQVPPEGLFTILTFGGRPRNCQRQLVRTDLPGIPCRHGTS